MLRIDPPASEKPVRTIVFSFDETYAKYFSVVLLSLAEHAAGDCLYDIVVLYDRLSAQTRDRLGRLVPEGFLLRFFDAAQTADECFGSLSAQVTMDKWAVSTFYDLLVPLVMPDYERVLFCDADTLFGADPGELFAMPFEGRGLIAVRDTFPLAYEIWPDKPFLQWQDGIVRGVLGIRDVRAYFNSGVLLFDVASADREAYLRRVRTALAFPELPTVDQDVLNYVFRDDVRLVHPRFNLQAQMLEKTLEYGSPEEAQAYREAAADPVIIHYATEIKPWSFPDCAMAQPYWETAARSPFYEEILRENVARYRKARRETSAKKAAGKAAAVVLGPLLGGKWRRRLEETRTVRRREAWLKKRLRAVRRGGRG